MLPTTPPTPAELAAAHAIAEQAQSHDGLAPISEQFLRNLASNPFLGAYQGSELVGFCTYDAASAELVVAPSARGNGHGTRLLTGLEAPVWAHGNLPPAQHLAAKMGREVVRELLVMEIQKEALLAAVDTAAAVPQGYSISTFAERPELKQQWLEANNQAFSWHPEQGGWDLQRLDTAIDTEWFSAKDVLFLLDESQNLVGFHWTKQVQGAPGEVYVVGLADSGRGKGLGTPLVAAGLKHLAEQGNTAVILYVEADNAPAVAAYQRLGFSVSQRHCLYGA
ncbi:mycothiol synthase [Corynebacterium sp. 35RC1]|nr:mycothiol synthase [Corynebacterium sp. 35RC1]